MALDIASLNKLGEARANVKGDYFRDGAGVVVIEELVYSEMNEGETFVARSVIIESQSKGDLDIKSKQPVIPNAPGSHVGWVQQVKKFKSAAGNIKAFLLALLSVSQEEMDASGKFGQTMFDLTQGKEQPARGMVLCYSTYRQGTKANPGDLRTYVSWSPAEAANTKEKIAARRAKLDAGQPITAEDC